MANDPAVEPEELPEEQRHFTRLGRRVGLPLLLAFFRGLPEFFEKNGYDYFRFRRIFIAGAVASWVIVLGVYAFLSPRSSAGALVAIIIALLLTLLLFPLAVAQSNRSYHSSFSVHHEE